MTAVRVSKLLAAAGVASRRGADALITAGRVSVDGVVVGLGATADPASATIAVDGRPVALAPPARAYVALHKPVGVTSTVRDVHARRTVLDLVPPALRPAGVRLFPVGRLDRDSEGLLLLTSDGDWAQRVLHPRYGVEREYLVGLERPLDREQERRLARGIALEEGPARFVSLRPAPRAAVARLRALVEPPLPDGLAWYAAVLGQGRRRQVRRMLAAVGAPVVRLARVRIGGVGLGALRSGAARALSADEVRALVPGRPGTGPARPGDPG